MTSRMIGLVAATALAGLGAASAVAAPLGGISRLDREPAAETVQLARMYWDGDWYCFYEDGWNGPGWYLCEYGWFYGHGWGGRPGWHGWRTPSRGRFIAPKSGHIYKRAPAPRIYRAPAPRTFTGGGFSRKAPGGGMIKGPSGGGSGKGVSGHRGSHRK